MGGVGSDREVGRHFGDNSICSYPRMLGSSV